MTRPRYEVRTRITSDSRKVYTVVRTGPKGGSKIMGIWSNRTAADAVCNAFSAYAVMEL